jgi:SAM-dependent methyltransferase
VPVAEGQANPVHVYRQFEDEHWWYVARRRILAELLQALVPAGSTVVDIGCGAGANIGSLAATYRCAGIDVSDKLIDEARSRFTGVEFIHGDAPSELGEYRGADVYLLMDVIEHIEHDRDYLASLVEALKPGAFLVLTVPADPRLWSGHDVAVGHWRRYTPATLRELWAGLPVTERLLAPFNSRLYPVVRTARILNNLRGRTSGGETDFAMPPAPVNRLLAGVMGSEAATLGAQLDGRRRRGFRAGVSLAAVLQK